MSAKCDYCKCLSDVSNDLVDKQENTAAFAGDDVYLRCSSKATSNLAWYNNSCVVNNNCGSNLNLYTIFNGTAMITSDSRYQIISNDSNGLYSRTLVIRSARLTDSSNYVCQDDELHSSTAKLVIIGQQNLDFLLFLE